ncbi:MAG: 8-amino-7-oxononanoate synthase [Planctomycetota bacterium]|jgi:glycine C-acetyltransferase/8-amino-7-oxononanoate synthase|nr:8-amino-7-oxononanoate synthase [Planctomycetota bacterium]MDP7131783.1 8-amino-7-oxononanoate synthase [Planctomycetota bacterium]
MSLEFIADELAHLKQSDLFREFRTIEGGQSDVLQTSHGEVLNLCSNNYLGLAERTELADAAAAALRDFGSGAGASRLVSGHMSVHGELERRIAEFEGTESALVFPTGYMANLGAVTSLMGKEDVVFGDRLNHASLIDGCRLSGATFRAFRHRDLGRLEDALKRAASFRRRMIATDGLFSMDGDVADVKGLVELADRYDAITLVDEAHATGVIGASGRGVCEALDVEDRVDVRVGTLSKAVGCLGGFVAGSRDLIDLLRNRARTFIFTTGLPPAICASAIAALDIIQREPELRARLCENVVFFRERLTEAFAERSGQANLGATESDPEGMTPPHRAKMPECPLDVRAFRRNSDLPPLPEASSTPETPGCVRQTASGESAIVTPIIPIIIGEAEEALRVAGELLEAGILIPAIRPPTVPNGTSRLRASVMATHTEEQLTDAARAVGNVCGFQRDHGRFPQSRSTRS